MKRINNYLKRKTMYECNNDYQSSGSMSCVYFIGMIGAAVYYISKATSFGMGIVGFLKALVWPAYLVYGILKHLDL